VKINGYGVSRPFPEVFRGGEKVMFGVLELETIFLNRPYKYLTTGSWILGTGYRIVHAP
jgi:hypothetical protein